MLRRNRGPLILKPANNTWLPSKAPFPPPKPFSPTSSHKDCGWRPEEDFVPASIKVDALSRLQRSRST